MWLRSQCPGLNDSGNLGLLELCDHASFSSIVLVLEAEIGSCPFGDSITWMSIKCVL
jgi:hypothetical protein